MRKMNVLYGIVAAAMVVIIGVVLINLRSVRDVSIWSSNEAPREILAENNMKLASFSNIDIGPTAHAIYLEKGKSYQLGWQGNSKPDVTEKNDTLNVTFPKKGVVAKEIVITVPVRMNNVHLLSTNGEIHVNGIQGTNLKLQTENGDVYAKSNKFTRATIMASDEVHVYHNQFDTKKFKSNF